MGVGQGLRDGADAVLPGRGARERLGLAHVAAFAHPDNAASRRVLERAGFEVERFVPAMGRYLYRRRLAPQPPPRPNSGPNGIE